ncbi:EAL domain-containing protein [Pseudarthrobacter sp. J75]|uniref:EAL domain-containing protein n=1 Tax=unclassified Pseudarthrobacter TaxID=2647000 RepID=UPI002E80CD5B|nr:MULTISPECIES: EAL domain-containing protein [unclassified Pseudarthrobacter]MEE2522050.1 EAL domain-containing protein [Pseudarthrobacter sp. J47]MEE2528975.1 EAL domain-containing protein [Pseudarthrobacter sp. J75]
MTSVRVQAWGIIAGVLANDDPANAAIRRRLCEHLSDYPLEPERALFLHLQETRELPDLPDSTGQEAASGTEPAAAVEHPGSLQRNMRISELLHNRMLLTAFQPIMDLRLGTVVGVEALSRFVTDDGASPDVWFAEATSLGRGADLEFSAVGSALRTAEQLPGHTFLSINISPSSCLDSRLAGLLAAGEIPLDRIVLELTESVRDDVYPDVVSALAPLRAQGLRIAVDDLNPDLGAMSRMVQLGPDFIKLGRNIISGIDSDVRQQQLAAGMVDFAARMGCSLVAEGVENSAELAALAACGITTGQGYFLGRPTVQPQDWASWSKQDAGKTP